MLRLIAAGTVGKSRGQITETSKREAKRIDRLAEELSISWRELNKLVSEIVGREIKDTRYLEVGESKKVIGYMKENRGKLGEKYRRIRWRSQS